MDCWIVIAPETYKISPSGPIALRQLSGFSTPGGLLIHHACRGSMTDPARKHRTSIDLPQARS
jgi:hypothetical protein